MRENPQKTPKTRERPARNLRETQEKLTRKPRESHKTNPYTKQKERTNRFIAEMSSLFLLVLSLEL